jgi:RNA polymerase sigma-70 factor (ECF subfamily)
MLMDRNKNIKLQLLILRTQAGCDRGFRELYDSFYKITRNYLSQLLPISEIDDIQQHVWLTVYQKISTLSTPFGFTKWLITITHRVAIDQLKKSNTYESRHEVVEKLETIDFTKQDITNIKSDIEYNLLYEALNKIPIQQKEVILLYYWQEFSCPEISQIVGCSIGTVKSRLFNARQSLERLKLHKTYNEDE